MEAVLQLAVESCGGEEQGTVEAQLEGAVKHEDKGSVAGTA